MEYKCFIRPLLEMLLQKVNAGPFSKLSSMEMSLRFPLPMLANAFKIFSMTIAIRIITRPCGLRDLGNSQIPP